MFNVYSYDKIENQKAKETRDEVYKLIDDHKHHGIFKPLNKSEK